MPSFFIALLLWGSAVFNSPSYISTCYYEHDRIGAYVKSGHTHQDYNLSLDIKYPVSEQRISTHTLVDGHTLVFNDASGHMFAELNIQMAAKKSFSQDVLTSFNYTEQHGYIKKIKGPITNENTLNIGGHQVYRTEAELSKVGNGGSYLYFPSEKMAVYFQFFHGRNNSGLTDVELTKENQSFILEFLKEVDNCVKK